MVITFFTGILCQVASVVSNSVRPHRRPPTRLPRPQDSPGTNTGVGCHFLLQCVKVKSEREVAQSCPTLRDPMDCSLPGSSVHGILQARVLEWGAIAFSASILYMPIKFCYYLLSPYKQLLRIFMFYFVLLLSYLVGDEDVSHLHHQALVHMRRRLRFNFILLEIIIHFSKSIHSLVLWFSFHLSQSFAQERASINCCCYCSLLN